jgi:Fur family ferric uptake transcriptional regulator
MKKKAPNPKNNSKDYPAILQKIKDSGLRITQARKFLLKMILVANRPFSAGEIFQDLCKKHRNENFDQVTVYRSLAAFQELGILGLCEFGDGTLRYEYRSIDGHSHHHHIICNECKRVEPIDFCVVSGQEQLIAKLGFSNVSHKLEFFGVCKKCAS